MNGCPVGMQVQSYLLDRGAFTRSQAVAWARRHGCRKVHATANYFRLRVKSPSAFRAGSLRTVTFSHDASVRAVVGCPA